MNMTVLCFRYYMYMCMYHNNSSQIRKFLLNLSDCYGRGDNPSNVCFQDGKVEPELFTEELQKELKSSPQPYLVPFLKVSYF